MKTFQMKFMALDDPEGLICSDEPTFLLRAQDTCAPFAVRSWAQRLDQIGGDKRLVHAAMAFANEMEAWPDKKMPEHSPAEIPPPVDLDLDKEPKPEPPPADPDKEPKPDPPVDP